MQLVQHDIMNQQANGVLLVYYPGVRTKSLGTVFFTVTIGIEKQACLLLLMYQMYHPVDNGAGFFMVRMMKY